LAKLPNVRGRSRTQMLTERTAVASVHISNHTRDFARRTTFQYSWLTYSIAYEALKVWFDQESREMRADITQDGLRARAIAHLDAVAGLESERRGPRGRVTVPVVFQHRVGVQTYLVLRVDSKITWNVVDVGSEALGDRC